MNHIRRISYIFLIIFNLLLIAIPLTTVLMWLLIETDVIKSLIAHGIILKPIVTPEGCINLSDVSWNFASKLILLVAQCMKMAPCLLGLLSLKTIFKQYQNGEIFIVKNAEQYRKLGFLLFLYALFIEPISKMLLVLSVTLSNPPGHRYLSVSFGTLNIETIFYGMLVIAISWVMLEGSRIDEECRLTI